MDSTNRDVFREEKGPLKWLPHLADFGGPTFGYLHLIILISDVSGKCDPADFTDHDFGDFSENIFVFNIYV